MSTKTAKWFATLALTFTGLIGSATHVDAQTTFRACRVPDVGAIYMIGVAGAPTGCLDVTHVEFSWTEGGATVDDGSVTEVKIADGAVTSAKIADGTVGAADLAPDAVDSSIITDGSVGAADLAPDAVDSSIIIDGSVGAADLAGGAVTTSAIAADAVTGAQIAIDAVNIGHIGDDAVGSAEIVDASISAVDLGGDVQTPVAWGFVNAAGGITAASANVTSATWTGTNWQVDLAGINYFWTSFVTLVTTSSAGTSASTSSVSGDLLVVTRNTANAPVQVAFQFVIYQ
jgi:hypothetical protein